MNQTDAYKIQYRIHIDKALCPVVMLTNLPRLLDDRRPEKLDKDPISKNYEPS